MLARRPPGVHLLAATPADLGEGAAIDMVVVAGVHRRKLTSHPTFLWVDRPLSAYLADPEAFADACAFDGYLCDEVGAGRVFEGLATSLDRPWTTPTAVIDSDAVSAALVALEGWEAAHDRWAGAHRHVEIDVIMRTGGRSPEKLRRAVSSLQNQSAGRIRLILVRHGPADLAEVAPGGRIATVDVVEAPGANRGRALAAGLGAVRSPFFSILDDDDLLLCDHFAGLLAALARIQPRIGFAYSDVLRLDDSGEAGGGGLSVLKQGPAAGPLTALLERFPSHSFLASHTALDGVRSEHWDMATAEDSLLVASLLRSATPVHSPNATAVYSQGAVEASAFGDHPQRRADELALHAETFAWRAEIEARFPVLAPDPLEHLRPALRRLEAAAEGRAVGRVTAVTTEAASEPALTGDRFHGGAFGGIDAVFVRLPLSSDRATGAALYVEPSPGGVQIGPQQPWEVGLRLDIADYALPGCPTWAVCTMKGEGASVSLGVVDDAGALIERTVVADTRHAQAVEVHGPKSAPAPALIVQAGPQGAAFCRVAEMRLGYRRNAVATALRLSAATPEDALIAALLDRFETQVDGAPEEPGAISTLDIADPASIFRHPSSSPDAAGALAVGRTGAKPWDYFAQIPFPAPADGPGGWIRLDLGPTPEAFCVFLVDQAFTDRLSRVVEVRSGKKRVEVWLPAPTQAAWLVMQGGASPQNGEILLGSVGRAG